MAINFNDDKIRGIFFKGDFDDYWIGHQISEIFKERIYAPYLEGKKDPVVIDIGGNIGSFSLYASKYAKQVYCLEPAKEHAQLIAYMLLQNELTNVQLINKAIYIDNKKLPFFHNKNKTMYSLHQWVNDGTSEAETVEAITLSKLFEDEKIEHVDLMKIDIEGTEFEVLCSADFAKVAPKIDVVIGETHNWADRNPQQLIDALKDAGFEYQTIEGDAQLFVGVKPQKVGQAI